MSKEQLTIDTIEKIVSIFNDIDTIKKETFANAMDKVFPNSKDIFIENGIPKSIHVHPEAYRLISNALSNYTTVYSNMLIDPDKIYFNWNDVDKLF